MRPMRIVNPDQEEYCGLIQVTTEGEYKTLTALMEYKLPLKGYFDNQYNKITTAKKIGSSVVECLRGCGFEPHWRHCIVSLSKTH